MPDAGKAAPLSDVFASQGIVALSAAILVLVLHLLSPAACRTLLTELQRIAEQSKPLPELWDAFCGWLCGWQS